MIVSAAQYGALTTKVRAMYGKRLKASELRRMASMKSVSEVSEYLSQTDSWSAAVHSLSDPSDRAALEAALRGSVRLDYLRLNHYVHQQDQALLRFPVLMTELDAILMTLRRLISVKEIHYTPIPLSFLQQGKLNYNALSAAASYDALAEAAAKTIYYEPLLRLRPEARDELPDYTLTEALLRSTYFSTQYRLIHRAYSGETRSILLRTLGEQVDLLNLVYILRLKCFFPKETQYAGVLFPFHYRLRPELMKALLSAPDWDSAHSLLEETPYAPALRGVSPETIDAYYHRAFYRFNRKHLLLSLPSVYSAVAYLNLRELELSTLIRAVECVYYAVPLDDADLPDS